MADWNAKIATPDASIPDDNAGLIGADSQSAATPSWYSFGSVWGWIVSKILANAETVRDAMSAGFASQSSRAVYFTDFLGSAPDGWGNTTSGTGAGVTTVTALGSFNAMGMVSLDLGTTNSGRAAVTANGTASPSVLLLGLGRARFAAKCAIHTLSNGTDSYQARIGFADSFSAVDPVDGVFFRYSEGINGGKWQAVTRSNSAESVADTGVTPAADALQLFVVDVNAAGTSADFYIDGVKKATITTNIPTGAGRDTGYGIGAVKSAGTTSTPAIYADYARVEMNFTAAR